MNKKVILIIIIVVILIIITFLIYNHFSIQATNRERAANEKCTTTNASCFSGTLNKEIKQTISCQNDTDCTEEKLQESCHPDLFDSQICLDSCTDKYYCDQSKVCKIHHCERPAELESFLKMLF